MTAPLQRENLSCLQDKVLIGDPNILLLYISITDSLIRKCPIKEKIKDVRLLNLKSINSISLLALWAVGSQYTQGEHVEEYHTVVLNRCNNACERNIVKHTNG